MNILVADDEIAIRELVGEILEGDGHEITLAEDGEDALEKFKRTWHEVVFSDIRMPKMNGIELLEAIMEINGNTQFVVMTSHASIDNSIDALKKEGAENVAVIVGGVIPPKDYDFLREHGACAIFGPGTAIPAAVAEVLKVLEERLD